MAGGQLCCFGGDMKGRGARADHEGTLSASEFYWKVMKVCTQEDTILEPDSSRPMEID